MSTPRPALPERPARPTPTPTPRAPAQPTPPAEKGTRLDGLGNSTIGAAARAKPTQVAQLAAKTPHLGNAATAAAVRASLGHTAPTTGPSEDLAALAALPPSQMSRGLSATRQAGAADFGHLHQQLAKTPPSLARPSGLPRKPTPTQPGTAAPPEPKTPKYAAPQHAVRPPEPDEPFFARFPLPAEDINPTELDSIPEDQSNMWPMSAAAMLGGIPTTDETVETSAGERPHVYLDDDADPAQMDDYEKAQHEPANTAWAGARQGMTEYEGENDIYPTVPNERLVGHVGSAPRRFAAHRPKGSALDRPDVAEAVDGAAAEQWAECTAKAQQDDADAVQTKEKDERDKRDATAAEIANAEREASEEQTGQQVQARKDVVCARQAWNEELATADKAYTTEVNTQRKSHLEQIEKKRKDGDDQARQKLDDAERQAEKEKKEKVAEAEAKKKEAEKESGGFWGWVKSKAKALINAIRRAINAIFDALRKFVKWVIDKAKKAAVWLIEQARRAVVGLIRAFGAVLEVAADFFLAAFPKARAKAKALIRSGVDKAEHAVNAVADRLKKHVCELLDALGAALDFILAAYQKIYNLILDAVEFVVVGLIEIIEGITRLADSASMVGDHFLGQLEEEGFGVDLTQPLAIEKPDGESDLATATKGAVASGAISPSDATLLERGSLNNSDVVVEPVANLHLEPELLETVMPEVAAGRDYQFGETERTPEGREAVLQGALASQTGVAPIEGTSPTPAAAVPANADPSQMTPEQQLAYLEAQETPHTCDEKKSEGPATSEAIPANMRIYGRFTPSQRFSYMWGQIKKGISQWWSCNWGKVVAAFAVGILITILLGILTGGAIFAAIPPLMEIIGTLLVGVAIVRATSYVTDYLSMAWKGNVVGGAKALARGFAILLVELVFALLFNAGAVIKALKSGLKGTLKAAVGAAKGAVKGTLKAVGELGHAVVNIGRATVRGSKLLFTGFREGFGQGIRSIGQLTREMLEKLHFRGFFFRLRGIYLELWGRFNPEALLGRFKITQEQAERWFKAIANAGKKIAPETRTEAEAITKALAKTLEEGGEFSKRLRDRVRTFFRQFKSQRIEDNPILSEVWKRALKELQDGGQFAKYFKDGELIADVPAEAMKRMYAAARGNVNDALKDVLKDLEKQFAEKLEHGIAKLPENVQIHHLVYKSYAPELAVEEANLVLALRKTGGSPDELHDLFHLVSAAGQGNRWRILNEQIEDIIRDLYKL